MNFDLPRALTDYLGRLDAFIDAEIRPLEAADDNIRFFDHRREWARTDFEHGGLPRPEWEALLRLAEEIRGQRRLGPVDGGDPRTLRRPGSRPAQRPAERALDRRQSSVRDHARPLWEARAAGDDRGQHHRRISHHL